MNATFERATRHLSDEMVSFGLICISIEVYFIASPRRLIAFFAGYPLFNNMRTCLENLQFLT